MVCIHQIVLYVMEMFFDRRLFFGGRIDLKINHHRINKLSARVPKFVNRCNHSVATDLFGLFEALFYGIPFCNNFSKYCRIVRLTHGSTIQN